MNYRAAFAVTVAISLALAVTLGIVWNRDHRQTIAAPQATPGATAPMAAPQQTQSAPQSVQPNLAAVQLTPERLQSIGVTFATVQRKPVHDEIRNTGSVEINEQRVAYVQTRFPGWIQKVFVDATYQYVRKGQPLFTIYSQELVSTEQEFLLAKRNQQSMTKSQMATATQEATWLLDAARQRLKQWNVSEREIARLESTGEVQREITVDSPVSGYVTERNALPNLYVQPETKLYTIADLSAVWVNAQVFQNDIGRLRSGDSANVTVDAYPERVFHGRVNSILPQVDPATRTVRVRLVFENPGLLLKPGMFVNVQLGVSMGTQLVVPASGVLQSGTRQVAFIDRGNGLLEPRELELGPRVGDEFVVLKGVQSGDRIVSSANFLIDSESQLQAALGSFAPPPPGASAAAINTPGKTANIEFTTDPSPPHKGGNTLRVKLSDANGKPLTGAQVTVTFFMPAMPAMGMAAMRTTANLDDKGSGLYEGRGELGSGGTWQVSIAATQNGQTLASKQMSVSATGGM
jgi:RND family efflux transporter MFP subunit